MTVYDLIRDLSQFPPDTRVVIIPQKREKWNRKDEQDAEYLFSRGFSKKYGAEVCEPTVEIAGVKK